MFNLNRIYGILFFPKIQAIEQLNLIYQRFSDTEFLMKWFQRLGDSFVAKLLQNITTGRKAKTTVWIIH